VSGVRFQGRCYVLKINPFLGLVLVLVLVLVLDTAVE
jgi:hypothetical protein